MQWNAFNSALRNSHSDLSEYNRTRQYTTHTKQAVGIPPQLTGLHGFGFLVGRCRLLHIIKGACTLRRGGHTQFSNTHTYSLPYLLTNTYIHKNSLYPSGHSGLQTSLRILWSNLLTEGQGVRIRGDDEMNHMTDGHADHNGPSKGLVVRNGSPTMPTK